MLEKRQAKRREPAKGRAIYWAALYIPQWTYSTSTINDDHDHVSCAPFTIDASKRAC